MDEISLDLLDKSPKYENLLLESENLKLESGNLRPESGKSRRNLEISAGFWKFLLEILSTSVGSGFFRILERKTEIDSPESVFGTNDPPPTGDLIGLAGFGSDLVGIFGWIGSSDWMDSPNLDNIIKRKMVVVDRCIMCKCSCEIDRKSVV